MPHHTSQPSPGDIVREWRARRGPVTLINHPARHEDWRVRAVFWRQERDEEAAVMADCAKPSAEWDEAFDTMMKATNLLNATVLNRLALRKLEQASTNHARAA